MFTIICIIHYINFTSLHASYSARKIEGLLVRRMPFYLFCWMDTFTKQSLETATFCDLFTWNLCTDRIQNVRKREFKIPLGAKKRRLGTRTRKLYVRT